MVSVRVCYQDSGKAVKGARVCLGFSGFFSGMSKEGYTDGNGDIHFENDPGQGKVYVNGKDVHSGQLSGRVVVYI